MSLELRRGYPLLLVNYGTGTTKIEHSYKSIVDEGLHKIEVILSTTVRASALIYLNCCALY